MRDFRQLCGIVAWEAGDFNELIQRIRQLVLPPQPEHHRGDLRARYFAETQRGKSVALWVLFRNLLADCRIGNCLVGQNGCEPATGAEWENEVAEVPADLTFLVRQPGPGETEWSQAPFTGFDDKVPRARLSQTQCLVGQAGGLLRELASQRFRVELRVPRTRRVLRRAGLLLLAAPDDLEGAGCRGVCIADRRRNGPGGS